MEQSVVYILVGALGGNLAGALLEKFNLGLLLNSLVGMVGGFCGAQLLTHLGVLKNDDLIASILGSTVGGGLLLIAIGGFKKLFSRAS